MIDTTPDMGADMGADMVMIRMDDLLTRAYQTNGLGTGPAPETADRLTGRLARQIGRIVTHPSVTATDLRWIAAALDAMAQAVRTAAGSPVRQQWRYDITGDRVTLHGPVLTATGTNIAVAFADLDDLIALLAAVTDDPAYRGWWLDNTTVVSRCTPQVHGDVVYAHIPDRNELGIPPVPAAWAPVDTVTVDLADVSELAHALRVTARNRKYPTAHQDSSDD